MRTPVLVALILAPSFISDFGSALAAENPFTQREVMVPLRDGVHLQTVIWTPANQKSPLPILLERTPYGVPEKAPTEIPINLKEYAQDGYIFVFQNLRGRFKSEGTFNLSEAADLKDPKSTNETTDAYDTIDWLVKNVPNNNGRVGIWGVSYVGLTAGMTLLQPHPALKAVSEQASPVDQWMNDDMHRYGALRESYALEYSVLEQADKNKNTHFDFDVYDTYAWYLQLGSLANVNKKYLHGKIPFWNSVVEHPNYDEFWRKEAWVNQLHSTPVASLNVAGFWDQEDPWGPWQIFRNSEKSDPEHQNFIVAGPWFHGQWQAHKADHIGSISFSGHETAREFRENIEAPFFRYFLHGKGEKFSLEGNDFSNGFEYLEVLSSVAAAKVRLPRTSISTATVHSPSKYRRATQPKPISCSTFPILANLFPIVQDLSLQPIRAATGRRGKLRISVSSMDVRTCCRL